MTRQQKRKFKRKLNISNKELDNMADFYKRAGDIRNREVVIQFLALTIEALRVEFGFGQKRIDRYTKRVDSLLDSVNLGYVSFEDLLKEIHIDPMTVFKMGDEFRAKKAEELGFTVFKDSNE